MKKWNYYYPKQNYSCVLAVVNQKLSVYNDTSNDMGANLLRVN